MAEKTFYDVHTHAMNLSHPYWLAFIQRFKIDKMLFLGPFASLFMGEKINNTKNLLSVMENDIGSYFRLMEKCLREEENPLLKDGELQIGGSAYNKIVLTPLMMDFGYKDIKNPDIYYNKPSKKPIVEQVIDVFNGIKDYRSNSTAFEIYPFLGLNTKNYSKPQIEEIF